MKIERIVALAALLACAPVQAELRVAMSMVDAKGGSKPVGHVTVMESAHGLVLTPALESLPPGLHGFHVHQNPSCEPGMKDGKPTAALAAGDHYDPKGTKRHGTPWGDGHLGDLPPLFAGLEGKAVQPVLAPRLKLKDLNGRSLMVHAGGDNHADHPAPLGGGGGRMACGVVPAGDQPGKGNPN